MRAMKGFLDGIISARWFLVLITGIPAFLYCMGSMLHKPSLAWIGFAVYLILLIWTIAIDAKQQRSRTFRSALQWTLDAFYQIMLFPPTANVHCAIWVPTSSSNPIELERACSVRPNALVDSIRRLSISKGIVGLAFRTKEDQLFLVRNPDRFEEETIKVFGLAPNEARSLDHNRRAYAAFPVLDDAKQSVLGVLYCSSKEIDAFDTLKSRVSQLLPFFPGILILERQVRPHAIR